MQTMDKAFMEQMKRKVENELREREIQATEYWLSELIKVYEKRHQQLADLQVDIQNLSAKMRTRLKTLKKGAD
ncbi:MAG: hypothetical protein D4R73_11410 [Deltaproteobacteria bacterium]|nr:hypothetical protein [Deltaproteobacteria bacterium]TSA06423.1 MAG: hypothetical protein D4R73_11410 [Deltaproteobacteria bacterium]